MANAEKMRIRCRQLVRARPCGLGSDTVGNAYGAANPVVVASAETAGREAKPGVKTQRFEEPKLGKVQSRLLLLDPADAHEMVEHFCDTECRQPCVPAS